MNRQQALARLAAEAAPTPPDLAYVIDEFRPGDAWGVAGLYFAVYGSGYPMDAPYVPELLLAAHERGDLVTGVARTPEGRILGQIALYRSSPPNKRLFEMGQMLVLPEYRETFVAFRLSDWITKRLNALPHADGVFGEAVCNHAVTQKLSRKTKTRECGLEPALMPEGAYAGEGAEGRVGCLLFLRVMRDSRRNLYVPEAYARELDFLLDGMGLDRALLPADQPLSREMDSRVELERFDYAGVARLHVLDAGSDVLDRVAEAEAGTAAMTQVFLGLNRPWVGAVVDALRGKGYFLGGLLPIWCGCDALLLQKLCVDPRFDALVLHSDRAKAVAAMVRGDWQRAVARS